MTGTVAVYESDELLDETVDTVVIGGGAAGLNGALMLARSRRSVVVIDSGAPRNAPAAAMHGFIALDGLQLPMQDMPDNIGRHFASGMAGSTEGSHINAVLVTADTDAALTAARRGTAAATA